MSAANDSTVDMEMKDLQYLEVSSIHRNDKNPRIHFPEEDQQQLAQSIDEKGVLVPVAVFQNESDKKNDTYTLIDGERRWLCCAELGKDKIPAVIRSEADDTEILLEMFNIHMVRQPWANMPLAWALERVVKETGTTDTKELARITGLSPDQVRRLLHALDLPKEYQNHIDDGSIPLNFFWELKTRVIDPLAKQRPRLWDEFEEGEVVEAFVKKRMDGVVTDVVSLRKVQPIINIAASLAGDDLEEPSPLDDAIRDLVRNADTTIDEAYEDTVEVAVETDKLRRKSERLVRSFRLLVDKTNTQQERKVLVSIAETLVSDLESLLEI